MARYKFLNLNPLNAIEEDCVTRAISLGVGDDYYLVQEKLKLVAKLFECETLCVCCYKYLLDNVYGLERIEEVQGMTIEKFAKIYNKGTYIVRIDSHLTTIINGTCYDIWDCTYKPIDLVWEVK